MKKISILLAFLFAIIQVNAQDTSKTKQSVQVSKDDIFKRITKKGNKVFIISLDITETIHANTAINYWGYWNVTTNRSEADFVLKLETGAISRADRSGKIIFLNPATNEELKTTATLQTEPRKDKNKKRQLIFRLIDEEVKPLFKE